MSAIASLAVPVSLSPCTRFVLLEADVNNLETDAKACVVLAAISTDAQFGGRQHCFLVVCVRRFKECGKGEFGRWNPVERRVAASAEARAVLMWDDAEKWPTCWFAFVVSVFRIPEGS